MASKQPKIIRTRAEMQEISADLRRAGETIGLVPTMGALHAGHLSLVRLATEKSSKSVVSIFVNPKQFNVSSDLESYPRDEARDLELLASLGVDYVFIPEVSEIYPEGYQSAVSVSELTAGYEGEGRPGHFEGVTTVVTILFHSVSPHFAVFGEKDFQQLRVIERMVSDLAFPLQIIRAPLIREEDGLALSSRNVKLSSEGRGDALSLSRSLFSALESFKGGERSAESLKGVALAELEKRAAVKVEYLEIVDEETLSVATGELSSDRNYRLLLTAYVEGIRLLDNMPLQG